MVKSSASKIFLLIIKISLAASSFISCASIFHESSSVISAVNSQENFMETIDAPVTEKGATETAANLMAMTSSKMKKLVKGSSSSNILRWAIYGIATELFHNVFVRTIRQLRIRHLLSEGQRLEVEKLQIYRQPPKHEIAIVTGATGGIGSQITYDLAVRGYDVVIAARDVVRGEALANDIRGRVKAMPVSDGKDENLPMITFVEYHADVPESSLSVASHIKNMGSPLSILINNAGIMGKSKQLTMKVNLLG